MTNTWNTRAIVLLHRPWREADRLYSVYTEQYGKQVLRAHGSRKITSKLAGSLEPFAEIDLFFIEAKQFPKIGGASVVHRFKQIVAEPDKLNAAMFLFELVSRLTQEDEPDPELYKLLYSTLIWIDSQNANKLVVYGFLVKVAKLLGYDLSVISDNTDMQKIVRWLDEQSYEDIQKLRVNQEQWNRLWHVLHEWLYDQLGSHVQSDRFLV